MAALARSATGQPVLGTELVVPLEIEDAARDALGNDGKRNLKGAKCIVKWIQSLESGRVEPALDYLITSKLDARFAHFFENGSTEVQLQAGVILGFLACGNAYHANSVIRQSISGVCLRLLSSPLPDLCIQSAWILGNLASESPACATKLFSAGVPERLLEVIKGYIEVDPASTNTPQTATILWTINSLEKSGPYHLDERLRYELIDFFVKLLKEEAVLVEDIIQEICLFFHGCCLEPRWLEALVNADVAPALVDVVGLESPELQTAALQVIGAISASEYDNVLVEAGVFPALRDIIIAEPTLRLAEDACWIVANLTDCQEHAEALMQDLEVTKVLCDLVAEVTNPYQQAIYEVRTREALRVIANITNYGTPLHVRQLVSKAECIEPMVGVLKKWYGKETVMLSLDTLWKLIQQGELCKAPVNDGEMKNIYWALFDMAGGDEGLRALVEHADSTVADTAANTLAMLAEMTESVAAAQAEAARTASPELLSRASLQPSGPFQDFPGLVMQHDPSDGPPLFDRLTPFWLARRDEDVVSSSSGSTAEVRRQLLADDDDEVIIGAASGPAVESETVVPGDGESCVQGPPSTVPESETPRFKGGGWTTSARFLTPTR